MNLLYTLIGIQIALLAITYRILIDAKRTYSNAKEVRNQITLMQAQRHLIDGKRTYMEAYLLDMYFGLSGDERRDQVEQVMREYPGRTPMASVLFAMHHHGDQCEDSEIVYKEKDIITLLHTIGLPVNYGLK